jgi:geranylgeranyl pyrophosphate synthase
MSAQAILTEARPFLDELEEQLRAAVAHRPGLVEQVGAEALAAGGKFLRPLLVHLTTSDRERALRGGVALELVHMASLVHDDVIDRAELRRGRPTAWYAHGEHAARTAGDYLFARAFGELAAAGEIEDVRVLSGACLALVRGEAMQRRQLRNPDTPLAAYFERIELKTGRLFEAACLLGSRDRRLGDFGRLLGIAFQIVDDILDCSGDTLETGKIAGTDLREGTPTLPLVLAARQDDVVRRALAGGSLDGALLRVGATDALERSREFALEYARRARACLDGNRERGLETLTHIVIDRER